MFKKGIIFFMFSLLVLSFSIYFTANRANIYESFKSNIGFSGSLRINNQLIVLEDTEIRIYLSDNIKDGDINLQIIIIDEYENTVYDTNIYEDLKKGKLNLREGKYYMLVKGDQDPTKDQVNFSFRIYYYPNYLEISEKTSD